MQQRCRPLQQMPSKAHVVIVVVSCDLSTVLVSTGSATSKKGQIWTPFSTTILWAEI